MSVPEGWTEDMNIRIGLGHTLDHLVDFILQSEARRDDSSIIIERLMADFAVSQEDAELALDRVCGGVVRAATGNPENCPDPQLDPLAFLSYQRCLQKPRIIADIYPKYASHFRKKFLLVAGAALVIAVVIWFLLVVRK